MVLRQPKYFTSESLLCETPPEVRAAPGMLSQPERSLLYGLAQRYQGNGAIIDGGSFFGSSTVSLAAGMAKAGTVHAYELGYIPASGNQRIERKFGPTSYVLGDSFVPILEEAVRPWSDRVELHIGDLLDEKWIGEPIEICFIDVCKTPALNAHVSREFYPHIIEGGYLVNQDYFFDRLPFVKATMGYLDEHFEWLGRVFTSSIWRCIKPVPQAKADHDPYLAKDENCLRWHDMSMHAELDDEALFRLAISRAYLEDHMGQTPDFDAIERDYADYIAFNVSSWDRQVDRLRRDAQFRVDRARNELSRKAALQNR